MMEDFPIVVLATTLVIIIACGSFRLGKETEYKYRDCRQLASIEKCVSHVGLEK